MCDSYIKGLRQSTVQLVGVNGFRSEFSDLIEGAIVTRFTILTNFSEAAAADISETISCSAISKSFLLDRVSEPVDLALSASFFSTFYSNRMDLDFSLFI